MPDFSREKVERVAKGLSKPARLAMTDTYDIGFGMLTRGEYYRSMPSLHKRGLVLRKLMFSSLTPLGLAVRQHLIGTGDGGKE